MWTLVDAVLPAPSTIVTDGGRRPGGAVTDVPSAVVPSENVQWAATTSQRWPPMGAGGQRDLPSSVRWSTAADSGESIVTIWAQR